MQQQKDAMPTCSCRELREKMDRGDAFFLLDVREPVEAEIAVLPGSVLVPMSEIAVRVEELESIREKEIIVYCHHGIRSAHVLAFLQQHGFEHVRNLLGGIDAYSVEVDAEVPRYY